MEIVIAALIAAVPASIAAVASWRGNKHVKGPVMDYLQDIWRWQARHEAEHMFIMRTSPRRELGEDD